MLVRVGDSQSTQVWKDRDGPKRKADTGRPGFASVNVMCTPEKSALCWAQTRLSAVILLPPYHTIFAKCAAVHWEVMLAFPMICLGAARIRFQRKEKMYG